MWHLTRIQDDHMADAAQSKQVWTCMAGWLGGVDRSWDPPVILGVRLVSVIVDALQHAGQAALFAESFSTVRLRRGPWCAVKASGRVWP